MEEMLFVGWQYGAFQNDNGRMQNYCNGFLLPGSPAKRMRTTISAVRRP